MSKKETPIDSYVQFKDELEWKDAHFKNVKRTAMAEGMYVVETADGTYKMYNLDLIAIITESPEGE